MRVRVVDHLGDLLVYGDLVDAWQYAADARSPYIRECVVVEGRGTDRKYGPGKSDPSWGACSVRLAQLTKMPLWYGGTYGTAFADFSLPSGLHNVWGQGNDFDTNAFRIHPDDVTTIVAEMGIGRFG